MKSSSKVDMCNFTFNQNHHKHPFSAYQEPHLSSCHYNTLTNADSSSNEHQILREIYQDLYAICTVKLLQIAHQNHQKKGLPGPGFLIFSSKTFADADATPELSRLLHFPSFTDFNLMQLKTSAGTQWNLLRSLFKENIERYTYAYMTPGLVSSLDRFGPNPPSYTGIGTLIVSPLITGAFISDGSNVMNGGFGSKLPFNLTETIAKEDWKLISTGNSYRFSPENHAPHFNGITSYSTDLQGLPDFEIKNDSNQLLAWKDSFWTPPFTNTWKSDVRQDHKSFLSTVGDPVDIISGAFYVDEIDLDLPGAIPLEIRRNYSSQHSLAGLFGFGWKLSLNPFLHEEESARPMIFRAILPQ